MRILIGKLAKIPIALTALLTLATRWLVAKQETELLGLVFLVLGLNAFLQFLKGLYPAASPDSFFRLYSSRTMCCRSAQCRRLAARCC
jgi:hypothetical protein